MSYLAFPCNVSYSHLFQARAERIHDLRDLRDLRALEVMCPVYPVPFLELRSNVRSVPLCPQVRREIEEFDKRNLQLQDLELQDLANYESRARLQTLRRDKIAELKQRKDEQKKSE